MTARQVFRGAVDGAAIFTAWSVQFAASGSYAAATITAAAVAVYGAWCFYDGAIRDGVKP